MHAHSHSYTHILTLTHSLTHTSRRSPGAGEAAGGVREVAGGKRDWVNHAGGLVRFRSAPVDCLASAHHALSPIPHSDFGVTAGGMPCRGCVCCALPCVRA